MNLNRAFQGFDRSGVRFGATGGSASCGTLTVTAPSDDSSGGTTGDTDDSSTTTTPATYYYAGGGLLVLGLLMTR